LLDGGQTPYIELLAIRTSAIRTSIISVMHDLRLHLLVFPWRPWHFVRLPARYWFSAFVITISALCLTPAARGDIFHLANGAQVRGHWVNRDERSPTRMVIETAAGIRVTLHPSQIASTDREQPKVDQYEEIAPQFRDTVADQWRLAEWCRTNSLIEHRARHLRRIVELDPQHEAAWHGLGYSQLRGKWILRKEFLHEQGYVFYRGRWRISQEIDVMESRHKIELAAKEWLSKLKMWRAQINKGQPIAAVRNIRSIRSPDAIPALAYQLAREKSRPIRLLYVDILGQIDDPRATKVLVSACLDNPDIEVFHASLEEVLPRKSPAVVKVLVKTLRNYDNQRVNRAAHALGKLNDPTTIVPLIDALVTEHTIRNPSLAGKSPGTTTTGIAYGPNDDIGTPIAKFGVPKQIRVRVPNHEALAALVEIGGGVSFGFDQQAWRDWHAVFEKQQTTRLSTRRD
jgi:hypothetical protein